MSIDRLNRAPSQSADSRRSYEIELPIQRQHGRIGRVADGVQRAIAVLLSIAYAAQLRQGGILVGQLSGGWRPAEASTEAIVA
jgi:hypothetical protein